MDRHRWPLRCSLDFSVRLLVWRGRHWPDVVLTSQPAFTAVHPDIHRDLSLPHFRARHLNPSPPFCWSGETPPYSTRWLSQTLVLVLWDTPTKPGSGIEVSAGTRKARAILAQHPSITGLGCVCPGGLSIRHGRAPSGTPPERCRPPLPPHRPWACTFHIAALNPSGNLILALLGLGKAYLPVDGAVRKLEFWFSLGESESRPKNLPQAPISP